MTNHKHSRERVFSIDLLRILAIIIVIMTHVGDHSHDSGVSFTTAGITGACVFFMASGALIFPIKGSGTEFVCRRLKRLLPPFIIWSAIYILLSYKIGGVVEPSPQRRALWMLFTPTFGPGWFILALAGIYLMAPIVSPWLERASRRSVESVLALWLIAGFMPLVESYFAVNEQVMVLSGYFSFMGYAFAGYYLSRWRVDRAPARRRLVFYTLMLALWLGYGSWLFVNGVNRGELPMVFSDLNTNIMAFSVLLFAVIIPVRASSKWLKLAVTWLSRHIYGVYLCHYALVQFVIDPLELPYIEAVALTCVGAWALTWLLSLIIPSRFIIKPY
jgi:surface polysaccharide O-acyltransferase-like enzyme